MYRSPYEYSVPGAKRDYLPQNEPASSQRSTPPRHDQFQQSTDVKRMDIPYTALPRRDTGLYNAKLGIWLFLASEVMLFGALFSSYILLRVGAYPGVWPHGI